MITVLYVSAPLASAAFYENLFGAVTLEASPGFALVKLPGDFMLGLWNRAGVLPAATGNMFGGELTLQVATEADVRAALQRWKGEGVRVVQEPENMGFGFTFAGLDPDGHRLRVFSPA